MRYCMVSCYKSFISRFSELKNLTFRVRLIDRLTLKTVIYILLELISCNIWVRARICKLQKGCTRLAAVSDKVYQLLARGRWFSPGTTASSTTKTGRHDIVEILLKVALSAINHHSNQQYMQSRDTGSIGQKKKNEDKQN